MENSRGVFEGLKAVECGSTIGCRDKTSGEEASELRIMGDETGDMSRGQIMKGPINHVKEFRLC